MRTPDERKIETLGRPQALFLCTLRPIWICCRDFTPSIAIVRCRDQRGAGNFDNPDSATRRASTFPAIYGRSRIMAEPRSSGAAPTRERPRSLAPRKELVWRQALPPPPTAQSAVDRTFLARASACAEAAPFSLFASLTRGRSGQPDRALLQLVSAHPWADAEALVKSRASRTGAQRSHEQPQSLSTGWLGCRLKPVLDAVAGVDELQLEGCTNTARLTGELIADAFGGLRSLDLRRCALPRWFGQPASSSCCRVCSPSRS